MLQKRQVTCIIWRNRNKVTSSQHLCPLTDGWWYNKQRRPPLVTTVEGLPRSCADTEPPPQAADSAPGAHCQGLTIAGRAEGCGRKQRLAGTRRLRPHQQPGSERERVGPQRPRQRLPGSFGNICVPWARLLLVISYFLTEGLEKDRCKFKILSKLSSFLTPGRAHKRQPT